MAFRITDLIPRSVPKRPRGRRHFLARIEALEPRRLLSVYFVNALRGNDANSGSQTAPWQTIDGGVDAHVFQPGDEILFHGGQTFSGTIILQQSAPASDPILIGSSSGNSIPALRPTINAGGGSGIIAWNTSGYIIQDLNIIGTSEANPDVNASTLTTSAAPGETQIRLASAPAISPNEMLTLGSGNATEQVFVAASYQPESLTVPLQAPITTSQPYGAAVSWGDASVLASATAAGAMSITVHDATGLNAGQRIDIDRGDTLFEEDYVAATYTPGSDVVPLLFALQTPHAAGAVAYWDTHTGISFEANAGQTLTGGIRIQDIAADGFGGVYPSAGISIGGLDGVSGFSGIVINNVEASDNGSSGVVISSYSAFGAFGDQNIRIANSTMAYNFYANEALVQRTENLGEAHIAVGASFEEGIFVTHAENILVSDCVVHDNGMLGAGSVGIWSSACDNGVIQYCESYDNHTGTAYDGDGFDLDGGDENWIIQYCYSHDNDGAGYAMFEYGSSKLAAGPATLATATALGATSVTLTWTRGLTAGQTILLDADGQHMEAATIASSYVAGSSLVPLTAPLQHPHIAGSDVRFLPSLALAAPAGATSIRLSSGNMLQPGEGIELAPNTSSAESVTVAASYIAGSRTVPLTAPLAESQPVGAAAEWNALPNNSNNIIRYNISQDDSRKGNYGAIEIANSADADNVANDAIYNNTIYLPPTSQQATTASAPAAVLINGAVTSTGFYNNIFQTAGGVPMVVINSTTPDLGVSFLANDYYSGGAQWLVNFGGTLYTSLNRWRIGTGQEMLNDSNVGSNVNPMLDDAGAGPAIDDPAALSTLSAYRLQPTSPMIAAALDLTQTPFDLTIGAQDFFGDPITPGQSFTIGADQE